MYLRNQLINQLLENDIEPIVTLYHWDLPTALHKQDCKGWICKDIVDHFEKYARYCFETYGDKVKNWITLNEPGVFTDEGYRWDEMAPGMGGGAHIGRIARHNTVLAHARAYHVYDTEFKALQNGRCGITLNSGWAHPETPEDQKATEIYLAMHAGWWAYPIYGQDGDYSPLLKTALKDAGEWETEYEFTVEEKKLNKGSSDFFGLNHYGSEVVQLNPKRKYGFEGLDWCREWAQSGSEWHDIVPWGFRELLKWIHSTFDSKKYPIYVTENGMSTNNADFTNGTDLDPNLKDGFRIEFYNDYIGQMHRAMIEDNVNIEGYTAWSLMDNFEWARGYTERFGVHWTNYTDPNREVFAKKSADFYAKVAKSNQVPGTVCCDEENHDDGEDGFPQLGLSLILFFLLFF